MYSERAIHTGFIGTLFLIGTLVLVFFHTRPSSETFAKLRAELDQVKSEVSVMETPQEELAATGELTEVEQKELNQAIPDRLAQDQILLELDRAAKAADVTFQALSMNLDRAASLPTVNISGSFRGSAAGVARFVKMLEVNAARKFVVKDAGVSRAETAEGVPLVTLSATIQSFYRYEK